MGIESRAWFWDSGIAAIAPTLCGAGMPIVCRMSPVE
jgi:hypothetical protein